jgi:GNAT superfamily N-acetyltransferase
MATIPLLLDGYTDLPPGKIANVVTYLEMTARPATSRYADRSDFSLRHVERPELDWYRELVLRIGAKWLWFGRAVMPDAALAKLIADPATELYVLERRGEAIGIAELDRSQPGDVEIALFGVVAEAIGTGAGRWLMQEALRRAFIAGVKRVWLHTCSFDHPAAIRFYLGFGFRPYKLAIEVSDDPRLTGFLPETAGPHVPLIRPEGAGSQ